MAERATGRIWPPTHLTVDQLRFGDFDGDGKTDVFSVDSSVDPHQWRYRSAGLGNWINLATDPLELTDLEFGDFDGNGKTDVFSIDPATLRGRYSPDSTQNWVNLDVQNIPLNLLRFGDFNGDGKTDIFTRRDNGQWSYLSAGLLPWIDVAHDSLSINDLRFGDFNADGKTDVFEYRPQHFTLALFGTAVSDWILLGPPRNANTDADTHPNWFGYAHLYPHAYRFGHTDWFGHANRLGDT